MLPPGVRGVPAVIEVSGLTKRFGDGSGTLAVDELGFSVGPGQVFGLLGPNGAGKTTTLRMLLGLVRPSAGRARLFGHEVRPGHPVLRRVGALVEGPGFLPHRSGFDNLRLFFEAGGQPFAEAAAERALSAAGLGDALHRPVRRYSHGMRQRLALAQALLGRPDLLLLDEPTSGLDPGQSRDVRRLLGELAAEGVTVLLSSHLLWEVEQVCSHVAVMDRGRLVAVGTVAEVVGAGAEVELEVDDAEAARRLLAAMPGVAGVRAEPSGLIVELDGLSRPELVAALVRGGVGVGAVVPRRRLEDAFLRLVGGAGP